MTYPMSIQSVFCLAAVELVDMFLDYLRVLIRLALALGVR